MPHSADAVANFFLDRAAAEHIPLTPMHIQKLVYYAHAWHMAVDGESRPLINEPIEAWQYGPVIRSLYREFKDRGNHPIETKAKELDWQTLDLIEPAIDAESSSGLDAQLVKAVLDRVWEIYKGYSAIQLSDLSHSQGEPWREIWEKYNRQIPRAVHIPNELIRDCFRKKLNQPAQPV